MSSCIELELLLVILFDFIISIRVNMEVIGQKSSQLDAALAGKRNQVGSRASLRENGIWRLIMF